MRGGRVAMIAFDLECVRGHVFEGWFDSLEAYEDQREKRMVICPYCEEADVRRVMSPVAIKRSNEALPAKGGEESIDYPRLAREVVHYLQKNFEDVGANFAGEALKIHYGVTERRNIRGSATDAEEKMLKDEGVDFLKLPVPKIPDDKKN
jgi:hypothetical protein